MASSSEIHDPAPAARAPKPGAPPRVGPETGARPPRVGRAPDVRTPRVGRAPDARTPRVALTYEIRAAHGAELIAGSRLLADSLGFEARDAIPPWLMQTSVAAGGLALGAFAGARLGGFSFALPAEDGSLFSCGLAVAPDARGGGVGRRLKLAQREWALARGIERIRWTAEPLSAVALTLYLSGLGARLASYEPGLYADVRPARVPPDDVVIDWDLRAGPRPVAREERRVEIPLDHRALDAADLVAWRRRVRGEMCRALDAGLIGTAVALDRGARRAWVLFQPPAPA